MEKGEYEEGSMGELLATEVWMMERHLKLKTTEAIVLASINEKLAIKSLKQCSIICIPGTKYKTNEEEMSDLEATSKEFCDEELLVIPLDEEVDSGILDL